MRELNTTSDYVIRVLDDLSMVDPRAWNGLLEGQAHPTPFLRWEYLRALSNSGSACAETGWEPHHVTVWRADRLVAAAAAYRKHHSYGEYVFDWAWADAYERHGLRYYPKLLVGVPFTPVPGSRLLAQDHDARTALAQALTRCAVEQQLSSAHALFADAADIEALAHAGWMQRSGVQFHWQRDTGLPASTFAELLQTMQRDKRKKVQQEQRRVRDAGITFRVLEGREIEEAHWDFFYRCYLQTYREHHSSPYLHRSFFQTMAEQMPEHWVMFLAQRGQDDVGCSLIAVDEELSAAWGRYWGALQTVDCLHFDACYYQPLAWCLEKGYRRFEGGAQGTHKMARGLLPAPTYSMHWLADQRFARAVDDFLNRERLQVAGALEEWNEHSPFKRAGGREDP